ncbi:MAG: signal peptidase I [Candidatus Saccharimonadaceae bacterium]
MEASYFTRHPRQKDAIGIAVFVLMVVIGTYLINSYVFRSFSVQGPSMETTLYTGDRLIVSRLAVTFKQLQNQQYIPERGQVIVFSNPNYVAGTDEEYLVKRVIGLPGDRVVVRDGVVRVYNAEHPDGWEIDRTLTGPGSPTSGEADKTVPENHLFVIGDHRQGEYSLDSRNGLGLVPLYDVIGPVSYRIFPFNKIRGF